METTKNNQQQPETQEQLVLKKAKLLSLMIENMKGLKCYLDELKELKWELKEIQSSSDLQPHDVIPS